VNISSPPSSAAQNSLGTIIQAGLEELWAETLGDPRICIAVLDGPVDQSHPSLAASDLTRLETLVPGIADQGTALQHGTHITSVIFGQHGTPIRGIAPHCRGLILPVFADGKDGTLAPCSQLDLARAITQAVQGGANIINISGGELSPSGTAHPLLADAVRNCIANGVLIVAAAGNEGCDCLHIPGALPSVLAVGAMNSQGLPLEFSNWGEQYQAQGILAPGENILGASPGVGTVANSGTSYATPIVSGIAALLLSLQLELGQAPNSHAVRAAILGSALGCGDQPSQDCRRVLAGSLNIQGAKSVLIRGGTVMSEPIEPPNKAHVSASENSDHGIPAVQPVADQQVVTGESSNLRASAGPTRSPTASITASQRKKNLASQDSGGASGVNPSACSCGCSPGSCSCEGGASMQLVYALGQLGTDFGTDSRRDSIMQHMDKLSNGQLPSPHDPNQLLAYFEKNPWDAEAILWTLNLDATPIYAIQPQGSFASLAFQRLSQFFGEQLREGIERVSIPGVIVGQTMLMSGQVVPVVRPELRGMFNWTTGALIEAVCGNPPPDSAAPQIREAHAKQTQAVTSFLERVYYGVRNLGLLPQERAINYAATNAFNIDKVFEASIKEEMELDTIEAERSPVSRPDSDSWDVKLTFFNPEKVFERARKVYRFTVDVSDVVPVTVGPLRSWSVR
jgi:cyanobactin maturation PatA/PatG family protease